MFCEYNTAMPLLVTKNHSAFCASLYIIRALCVLSYIFYCNTAKRVKNPILT